MAILDANGAPVAPPAIHVEFSPGPAQPCAIPMNWPDGRPGAYIKIIGGMTPLQELAGRIAGSALAGVDPAEASNEWLVIAGAAAARMAHALLAECHQIQLAEIEAAQVAAAEAAAQANARAEANGRAVHGIDR